MILSSIVLVLVSSVTLVIGVREPSMRVVYISLGCGIVSGVVLVMSVRARSAARDYEAWAGDGEVAFFGEPRRPSAPPAQALSSTEAVARRRNGSPPPTAPASSVSPVEAARSPSPGAPPPPPGPPASAPSAHAPVSNLHAPGPGTLGRLRRRPLAGPEGARPPQTAQAEDRAPGPAARRSGGEACATARRTKSDPRSAKPGSGKAAETRKAAGAKAGVPRGPSAPRSRTAGKTTAGKGARATGPSGARQGSRNGAGPGTQNGSPEKAAKR